MKLLHSIFHFFLLITSTHSCNELLTHAFQSIKGFNLTSINTTSCSELKLPSKNLTGPVSWMVLHNITTLHYIDLSNNAIEGSIPGAFWSNLSVQYLNVAGNHLGGALRLSPRGSSNLRTFIVSGNRFTRASFSKGFVGLESLDLSNNSLKAVPSGLEELKGLKYLNLSHNSINGVFPATLAKIHGLVLLNVSYNNFSGVLAQEVVTKFGRSAFIHAGKFKNVSLSHRNTTNVPAHHVASHDQKPKKKSKRPIKTWIYVSAAILLALVLILGGLCILTRRRNEGLKKQSNYKDKESRAKEVRRLEEGKGKLSAPVVIFEKPLIELTFGDLVTATSGFGKESQLAETSGRSGPAFRAVLPGEMHVVVRVVEDESISIDVFRDIGRLRHPNLLPLVGCCISGKQKLAIYEYIEKGNLHRFLHELPTSKPNNDEDYTNDTWEQHHSTTTNINPPPTLDWPTRHRIALGVARGLAFLHQFRTNAAHGHLVATNILIADDLEPRISDYGFASGGTVEGDVYDYGVVVMELVTGLRCWTVMEVGKVREMVRTGRAGELVDRRLREDAEELRETAECLRVGYLCTAPEKEKRPTMQQVVGLIKEIRRAATGDV